MPGRRLKRDKPADIDTMLRHVSRRHPHALPRALFDIKQPIEEIRCVETQFTARQRRVDRAICVKIGGKERLLHIEWTYRLDRFVGARIYEYHHLIVMGAATDARANRKENAQASKPIRVDSVVVVLTGPKNKRFPKVGFYRSSSKGERFSGVRYRIEAIYQRMVGELEAMGSEFWLAFVPLAVDVNKEKLERVLETLKSRTNPADFAELAAMMIELAHVKKDRTDLTAVIRSHAARGLTMQSFVYKGYFYGEGVKEGREQALVQLLERRIRRSLTSGEQRRVSSRLLKKGTEFVGDAMLNLSCDELVAWLAPNGHRTNVRRAA